MRKTCCLLLLLFTSIHLNAQILFSWQSGSNSLDVEGSFGTLNVPDASNAPRARTGGVSWIDDSDQLWLFGGLGVDLNEAR